MFILLSEVLTVFFETGGDGEEFFRYKNPVFPVPYELSANYFL